MASFKLHHIGFASRDLREAVELLASLGLELSTPVDSDPVQGVKAGFVEIPANQRLYLEILEPLGDSSPISRFLAKRGGGLHHLCFEVDDLEARCRDLLGRGLRVVVEPVDCPAVDRTFGPRGGQSDDRPSRVAFLMLGERLLVELLERGT